MAVNYQLLAKEQVDNNLARLGIFQGLLNCYTPPLD